MFPPRLCLSAYIHVFPRSIKQLPTGIYYYYDRGASVREDAATPRRLLQLAMRYTYRPPCVMHPSMSATCPPRLPCGCSPTWPKMYFSFVASSCRLPVWRMASATKSMNDAYLGPAAVNTAASMLSARAVSECAARGRFARCSGQWARGATHRIRSRRRGVGRTGSLRSRGRAVAALAPSLRSLPSRRSRPAASCMGSRQRGSVARLPVAWRSFRQPFPA